MRARRPSPANLRAEARFLATAGLILLALGFPATLILVGFALTTENISPTLPLIVGAPPIGLGYLACAIASRRMVKAKALERSA